MNWQPVSLAVLIDAVLPARDERDVRSLQEVPTAQRVLRMVERGRRSDEHEVSGGSDSLSLLLLRL